jgi:hypothetical protein
MIKMKFRIQCSFTKLQNFMNCLPGILLLISFAGGTLVMGQDLPSDFSPESVFVNTDRELYVSGESVLFNVYLFSSGMPPERSSKFVYLLMRGEHEDIERFTLPLNEKNQSSGVIYIPDTLSSGVYQIIAFTNYMRNWGQDIFFTKELVVVNRFDTRLENFVFEPNKFFLETDSTTFDEFGSENTDLLNLKVLDQDDRLYIKMVLPGDTTDVFDLQVLHKDLSAYEGQISITSLSKGISIEKNNLPEGLLKVVLSDGKGAPVIERYYYNELSTVPVRISSPGVAGRKERVEILIENNDVGGKNVTSLDLNISVLPIGLNQHQSLVNIQRRKNMQHYLRGLNAEEQETIRGMNVNGLNLPLADDEMDVSSKSTSISKINKYTGKYPMEDQQVLLNGKVVEMHSGEPVSGARVILNTPDSVVTFAYSITKENGEFSFHLVPYYFHRDIYLTVDPETYSGDFNIIVNDRFELNNKFKAPDKVKVDVTPDEITRFQDIVRVQKIYQLDNFRPGLEADIDPAMKPLLYIKPGLSVLPSLYVELDDFQEIARELITPLSIRRSQNNYSARMFCARSASQLQGSPVFFVDGIIAYDLNPLITLGSEHIREVQVINLSWVFGNMLFPGIVGIFTYNEEFRSIGLNGNRAHYYFDSYKIHPVFTPPIYETNSPKNHNSPDMRLLLHWENDVQLNAGEKVQTEFFTGDLPGEYLISIQGMDQDGNFFQAQQIITVQ